MKRAKSKSTAKKRARKGTSGSARKTTTSTSTPVGQTLSWINESLSSPLVRQAVAAALVAGAGAAAAVLAGKGSMKAGTKSLGTMISGATKGIADSALDAFAGAAGDATREMLPPESDEPSRSRRSASRA